MKRKPESNTIIRTDKRENPYVMLDKYGLNDERLSWKAKGLLAYLLSKPDDWQIYERELMKRSTDGRDAVRTGLRELETCGYLSRRQIRGEDGSFGHMEYIVYERPLIDESTVDGKSVHGENPQTENPSTVNPTTVNPTTANPQTENPLLLINDLTKNDSTMFEYMGAAAESAVASESNPIFESLLKHAPTYCYVKSIPLGHEYITEIYLMLVNQFSMRLDPAVVEIACELYFERACMNTDNGVVMKLQIDNPVGYFKFCYEDAIKKHKLTRNRKK